MLAKLSLEANGISLPGLSCEPHFSGRAQPSPESNLGAAGFSRLSALEVIDLTANGFSRGPESLRALPKLRQVQRQRGIPKNRREESWLRADEPLGQQYWAHHNSAANYAVANRHTIVAGIQDATRDILNAETEVYYEISHNLVQH